MTDWMDDDTIEPSRNGAWRAARRVLVVATVLGALALGAATPAYAIFATEATLVRFEWKQLYEMGIQYALQKAGWSFHRDKVNGGIEAVLATIYDELAGRHSYREIGFTWETPDPIYGRVDRLLGLLEGEVPQTEAAEVAMENAFVQVIDMKTGREERKLVLERNPGAALRYARYAAVMKTAALGGDVYAELEKHRETVEILRRLANAAEMSPGRSEQVMRMIDYYESLLSTNTAELDAVRSNAQGIDRLYEAYADNLREAARYQADSVARRQTFGLETSAKPVYAHSWD